MKKNTLIKIFCLLLVCVMILPLAIACNKDDDDENDGGNTNTNTSTDTGNNGGNGGNTDGGNDGGNSGGSSSNTVTIFYDPGDGLLEDDEWEVVIQKGSRKTTHPTPTHEQENQLFLGWYTDERCTIKVKTAQKYEQDTTLYAKWLTQIPCSDGSYDHQYGNYYTYSDPDCTEDGQTAQDCTICGATITYTDSNNLALGHKMSLPVEAGFGNKSVCERPGCDYFDTKNFVNVTNDALGNDPSKQVELTEGSGTVFNEPAVSNIVNGTWDEENAGTMAGKGGQLLVTITLVTPTQMDRIYVKGRGPSSFDILVQYQGDSEFYRVGGGSFLSPDENTKPETERRIPFAEVDNTRLVAKVQIKMANPSNGSDYWEEVGFFRLPVDSEE